MAQSDLRYWSLRIAVGLLILVVGLFVEYSLFKGEITLGILSGLRWLWSLLFVTYTLNVWQTILILVVLLTSPWLISAFSFRLSDYTTDTFLGVRWRWEWDVLDDPTHITPFCPECDFRLELEVDNDPLRRRKGTVVNCEECGFDHSWDRPPRQLLDYIRKMIKKKVRSEEWVEEN